MSQHPCPVCHECRVRHIEGEFGRGLCACGVEVKWSNRQWVVVGAGEWPGFWKPWNGNIQ
jgi:hypothetical protein